jgi:hypothetical protein
MNAASTRVREQAASSGGQLVNEALAKVGKGTEKKARGSAPLAALLGPMALRRQAHVGVPPPALALRGGSLLYRSG